MSVGPSFMRIIKWLLVPVVPVKVQLLLAAHVPDVVFKTEFAVENSLDWSFSKEIDDVFYFSQRH